jgi:hypothetical protein
VKLFNNVILGLDPGIQPLLPHLWIPAGAGMTDWGTGFTLEIIPILSGRE